ncbi:MAG: phosphoribosylanthranilate isomerase [Thermoanaerobaculia bacterium]
MIVKICGITRSEDARAAVEAGADWIGLVFAASSPRRVDREAARAIAESVRGHVTIVGVFVDAPLAEVNLIADDVGLDVVQLHGDEPDAYCAAVHRPVVKAVRIGSSMPPFAHPSAAWVLYDTQVDGLRGGAGRAFDWSLLAAPYRPFFLAGGLRPSTVAAAIAASAPDGVDVSSGVELRPGIKDHDAIRSFVEEARRS